MKKLAVAAVAMFAMFALLGAACGVEPEEGSAEESVARADDALVDEAIDAEAVPPELMLVTPPPAGCSATVTCAGVKTCGAWSAFTQCGAQFSACDTSCIEAPSAFGRAGCQYTRTFIPQNRTRSCVMRATGQTCVETGYLARGQSCTPVDG